MQAGFAHFELQTPDLAASKKFYGGLFGWKFEELPIPGMKYAAIKTGAADGGALETKNGPGWLSYATVEDLDGTAAKAVSLGAKVLKARTEVPNEGSFVVLADPQGAPFALWQKAGGK